MSDAALLQGSDDWRRARCGSLGASQVADALARTKSGWGASRANVMAQLAAERLTGLPIDGYQNDAMRRGNELEPDARAAYSFRTGADVHEIGLVRHPRLAGTHASPDGLIADDGLLEIKCPSVATHIEYLISQQIPQKYVTQIEWQLICTGRRWADFCSYAPELPESMRLFIRQVELRPVVAAEMEREVAEFLSELDAKVATLKQLYGLAEAA